MDSESRVVVLGMNDDEMTPDREADDGNHSAQEPFALLTYNEIPLMLPIPSTGDSLEVTVRKLRNLAAAVQNGSNLSLTSGMANPRDAEAFAKKRMSNAELQQYEAWMEKTLTLPNIDWAANRFPVQSNGEKTLSQYAKAMDVIWDHDGAVPENVMWLGNRYPSLMALVKAVTKLSTSQAHLELNKPYPHLSDSEIAELQTLQMITATADENLVREKERLRQLTVSMNESISVLKEKTKSLRK